MADKATAQAKTHMYVSNLTVLSNIEFGMHQYAKSRRMEDLGLTDEARECVRSVVRQLGIDP